MLANSVAQTPVVLGFFNDRLSSQGLPEIKAGFVQLGDDPKPLLTVMKSSVMSIKPLQEAAAGNGSLSLGEQIDDVVRRVPMFLTDNENIYPAFALETLRVAFGETTYALKTTTASTENVGGELAMVDFKVGQFVVPVDELGRFLIHYSRNDPALYVSSKDILELPPEELEPLIRDHIVFIGATATGLRDIRVTTLGENVPGVYMHAQIADQILSQSFLERPDWAQGAEIAAMLLISLLIIAILPFAGPLVSAGFGALSSVAVLAGSWFAFDRYGILLDPLFPMLTGTAIFLTTTILLFAFTEREKRFVRGAFQRYLAPDLLLKLERNPDSLKLGGEIRQMTLMFMDIRGFTPISEKLVAAGTRDLPQQAAFAVVGCDPQARRRDRQIYRRFDHGLLECAAGRGGPPAQGGAGSAGNDGTPQGTERKRRVRLPPSRARAWRRADRHRAQQRRGLCRQHGVGHPLRLFGGRRYGQRGGADRVHHQACGLVHPAVGNHCSRLPGLRDPQGGLMALKGKSKPATLYALIGDEKLATSEHGRSWPRATTNSMRRSGMATSPARRKSRATALQSHPSTSPHFYGALIASVAEKQPA